jgi:prepilin-type N-terminal cleavage/methylation domain-containing protein
MNRRRGVSLVELLLAMTALSIILTLSVGLIHRMLRVQMQSRASADSERTALRLAGTFRRDVWQAASAAALGGDAASSVLVRLELPNHRSLEYGQEAAAVVRLLKEGERIIGRERFVLPEGTVARIERESGDLLQLSVAKAPPAPASAQNNEPSDRYTRDIGLRVVARIGRDAAFVPRETAGEDDS